jgi:hypothetical protein
MPSLRGGRASGERRCVDRAGWSVGAVEREERDVGAHGVSGKRRDEGDSEPGGDESELCGPLEDGKSDPIALARRAGPRSRSSALASAPIHAWVASSAS